MDTCWLCLPDSLSEELKSVAQSGFLNGFTIGSACCLSMGMILIVVYLINRGAGH